MALVSRGAFGVSLLRLGGERRDSPPRTHDHRRAQAERDLRLAAIEAELRELVVRLGAAALSGRQRGERAPAVLGGFLPPQEFPAAEFLRTFERCDARVGPEALEIRMPIRRPRRCRCRLGADDGDETHRDDEASTDHDVTSWLSASRWRAAFSGRPTCGQGRTYSARSSSQRIRADLELCDLAFRALAAFDVPDEVRAVIRVQRAALPSGVRVIDAAVHPP